MMTPSMITVFPKPNSDICGLGCSKSCASCQLCGISCGFYEAEIELLDDIFFILEKMGQSFEMEIVDTSNVDKSIVKLNALLTSNGESQIDIERYGEYMTVSAPLIAVNNKIVAMGEIPERVFLVELVKEIILLPSTSAQES